MAAAPPGATRHLSTGGRSPVDLDTALDNLHGNPLVPGHTDARRETGHWAQGARDTARSHFVDTSAMIAALKTTFIREKRGKRADRAKRTQTANRKQTQSGHSFMMPPAPSTTIDVAVSSAQNGSTSLITHDNTAPGTASIDRRNHAKLAMFPIPEHNNKIMDVISPHHAAGTDAVLDTDRNE